MKSNIFSKELGFCAACGAAHVSEDGFDNNRGCRECGEWLVYNLDEYRDILIDWVKQQDEIQDLYAQLAGAYE